MKPGSVIVDRAVEQGEIVPFEPNQVVDRMVQIIGYTNLASRGQSTHQHFAKSINFVCLLIDQKIRREINMQDEIILGSMITKMGKSCTMVTTSMYQSIDIQENLKYIFLYFISNIGANLNSERLIRR